MLRSDTICLTPGERHTSWMMYAVVLRGLRTCAGRWPAGLSVPVIPRKTKGSISHTAWRGAGFPPMGDCATKNSTQEK